MFMSTPAYKQNINSLYYKNYPNFAKNEPEVASSNLSEHPILNVFLVPDMSSNPYHRHVSQGVR